MSTLAKSTEMLFQELTDDHSAVKLVRNGISPTRVLAFIKWAHLTQKEFLEIARLKPATFYDRLKKRKKFDQEETDRIFRIIRAHKMAEGILGSTKQARSWFQTEVPALGNITPWSLLDTEPGAREVETLLMRIEHGIYS